MYTPLQVRDESGDLAAEIPDKVAQRLGLTEGSLLAVHETVDGILLCLPEADAEKELRIARKVAEKRRDALRKLAEN